MRRTNSEAGWRTRGPYSPVICGTTLLAIFIFLCSNFFFWTCLNFCTSRLHETLHFYGNSYYTDFYLAPKCFWGLTRKRTLKALVLIIHSLFLLVLTVELCTHSLIKLLWHMTWREKFGGIIALYIFSVPDKFQSVPLFSDLYWIILSIATSARPKIVTDYSAGLSTV